VALRHRSAAIAPVPDASQAQRGIAPKRLVALDLKQPGRYPVGLCFDTYNEAADFLTYLKAANAKNPSRIGNSQLGFVEPPAPGVVLLTARDLAGLEARAKCF
jgi:hypothetical protein